MNPDIKKFTGLFFDPLPYSEETMAARAAIEDVGSVTWIEDYLAEYRGACLFVTHDRCFLDRIATRIVELDHGKFYSCEGSYADFLAAKEVQLHRYAVYYRKRRFSVLASSAGSDCS